MGKRKAVTSKKAWKTIDTADVEEALQAKTKALLRSADPEHKSDTELFSIDKQGTAPRTGRREPWQLKSSKILEPNSKIPVLESNHPRRRPALTEEGKVQRIVQGGVKPKPEKKRKPAPSDLAFDLWGDQPAKKDPAAWPIAYKNCPLELDSAIDPETFISKKRQRTAANLKPEPSATPSVPVPHPGASYRPAEEAHKELMGRAAAAIVAEEEKKRQSLVRAGGVVNRAVLYSGPAIDEHDLPDQVSDDEEDESEQLALTNGNTKQPSKTNPTDKQQQEEEEDDVAEEGGGDETGANQVEARKLTRAERNRQARARAREEELQAQRDAKKSAKQLNRIGELSKEVRREVRDREAAAQRRSLLKPEVDAGKIRRLGPYKLKPKAPEVLLPEQVPKSFRAMPPAANALKDHFEGLQKRNLIEPRFPKSRKKTLTDRKTNKIKARAFIDY